jgi:hypothetical protein
MQEAAASRCKGTEPEPPSVAVEKHSQKKESIKSSGTMLDL